MIIVNKKILPTRSINLYKSTTIQELILWNNKHKNNENAFVGMIGSFLGLFFICCDRIVFATDPRVVWCLTTFAQRSTPVSFECFVDIEIIIRKEKKNYED